ncbi:MAG TPA: 2Fe-2S iron-sulfur cluster-binding protein [Gammaproteobacteria bacterium]
MGFRVRVEPSGREFIAEPQETLLEAALRSGVSIHYNCSSGSCGECRARILAGHAEDRDFHDFVLSEHERNHGVVLLCTTHATSDLVIEARIAGSAAEIPHQQFLAKIAKVEPLSDDVVLLLLRTPRSRTLRFLAGQHVVLRAAGQCIDLPIASCPCNGMLLQFHLLRGRDEPLLSWLLQRTHGGDSVEVAGPFGTFTLDEASPRAVVMVAEETGFATLKSLIEHYINLEKSQPLHLYRLAHSAAGFYLGNLCESWRDAIDNFTYTPLTVAPGALLPLLQHIADEIPAPAATDLYLVIPEEIASAAQQLFIRRGVPARQIAIEHHRTAPRSLARNGTDCGANPSRSPL